MLMGVPPSRLGPVFVSAPLPLWLPLPLPPSEYEPDDPPVGENSLECEPQAGAAAMTAIHASWGNRGGRDACGEAPPHARRSTTFEGLMGLGGPTRGAKRCVASWKE